MATENLKHKRETPEPTPTQATAGTIITFDPNGDLVLEVGTDSAGTDDPSREMLVDSRALCRASPVFRAMLSDRFSEAKPKEGGWKVKLPEDAPDAFVVLMDIIHGIYDRISTKLSPKELYKVCILTNKYDMTQALRPILASEANSAYRKCGGPSHYDSDYPFLLFIAWETGQHDDFKALLMNIVFSSEPQDTHGNLCHDEYIESVYGAHESIAKCRQAIVTAVLARHRYNLLTLLNGNSLASFCRENNCREGYYFSEKQNFMVLGEYFYECWQLDLMDGFNFDYVNPTYSGSLETFEESFEELTRSSVSCRCGGPAATALAVLEKERDEQASQLLTDEQKQYMSIQAAKLKGPSDL